MERPQLGSQIIFLGVGDYEASTGFYEELLGLNLVLDQGGCRIYRTGRDAYLGICRNLEHSPGSRGRGVIITLVVEDVDGWYRCLVERGVTPESEPRINPEYQIYHFMVKDPDGYTLEFQRFLDPGWNQGGEEG